MKKQKKIDAFNTNNTKCTICFVAGKSGGHIIPAITLAKQFVSKNKHIKITFFTTNSPLDKKIIIQEIANSKTAIKHIALNLENIPYKKILQYPLFFTKLAISFFKSFFTLIAHRPKKVISMGGHISLPVCLAAYTLRIPIELYELNATPGKAVKFLAPFATTINTCFKKAVNYFPPKKCKITQYPIRFAHNIHVNTHTKQINPKSIYQKHGFSPKKQTILILGGSQGSIAINNIIKQIITKNPDFCNNIQIIHQTGDKDNKDNSGKQKTNWDTFYKKMGIPSHTFGFKSDINAYYRLADLVICRSGAGTLFETLFFQKPCITIPLETATTVHQVDNAKEMAKAYPNLVKMVLQSENIDILSNMVRKTLAALPPKNPCNPSN